MTDLSYLSNASGLYRSTVGGGSKPESYSTTFITPQGNYTFISEDVVNKGLQVGGNNYWFPYFQNKDNLTNLVKSAQQVDLSDVKASGITSSSTWGDWVSSGLKQSPKGYLVPEGAIPFDSEVKTKPTKEMGEIKGLGTTSSGELVYTLTGGHGNSYISPDGTVHDPYVTYSSILGDLIGGLGEAIASPIRDVSNFVSELGPIGTIGLNMVSPGLGTAITVGNEAGRGNLQGAAINAALGEITGNGLGNEIGVQVAPIWANGTDPNAVGGVTGPDNIDVGGGWSPATGATAAELEAARLALEQTPAVAPELTAQEVLDKIQADQASAMTAQETQAMIDAEAAEAAKVGATPAQVAAAKAAGMTVTDYLKAGLLVNAITGDPLGLGGSQGQQGAPSGSTGFAQVPIPAEWKSPTYATTPVVNTTFEDLFPGVSLQGTQWAGLQNAQPNVSFNDIFASGLQSTPTGTPVNIGDIVGAIIGQSAKS